jgi:hypothetical protein
MTTPLRLELSPEELLVLHAANRVAFGTISRNPSPSAREMLMAHLDTWLALSKRIDRLNYERETGMARPTSDKVFIHAGLRPKAHAALYAHAKRSGGGSIKPGSLGDILSDLIEEAFTAKGDVAGDTVGTTD